MEGLETEYPDDLHTLGLHAGVAILAGMFFSVTVHAFLESDSHSHEKSSHAHAGNATCAVPRQGAGANGTEGTTGAVSATDHSAQGFLPVRTGTEAGGARHTPTQGVDTETPSPSSTVGWNGTNEKTDRSRNLRTLIDKRKGKSLTDLSGLQSVCWNVIIGDFVHNFADGVTIGAAFLGCSSTIGWTVTASAVLHEVPHELADFMTLINGGMSAAQVWSRV